MKQELTKQEKINMDIKDIAKAIRKDLKKEFGKDIKFSVRISRFAGGQSLSVNIKQCSEKFFRSEADFEREYMEEKLTMPSVYENIKKRFDRRDAFAVKKEVRQKVDDIVNFYNYDESEPMYDYFNVNFYYSGVDGDNIEVI